MAQHVLLVQLLLMGLIAGAVVLAEVESPAPLEFMAEAEKQQLHSADQAAVHAMQTRAYEQHLAEQAAIAAAAPALDAEEESLRVTGAAGNMARGLATVVPAEIRITTSLDATVLALTAAQQTVVTDSVNTAVMVFKKFLKVNVPVSVPLTVSSARCLLSCSTNCNNGETNAYAVPAQLQNGTGQPQTDFFISVRADLADNCVGSVAWAFSCYYEAGTNRPTFGIINVCTAFFQDSQFSPPLNTRVDTLLHELMHALGFANSFNSQQLISFTSAPDAYGDSVYIVNTTRIAALTKSHFGCPTAIGAQLEDLGGAGSANGHWDYRIFAGELMAPSGGYLMSNFSLSLMADLGYYTPRYNFAAPFVRGRGKGCALLDQTCAQVMAASASQEFYCGTGTGTCVDAYDRASCSGASYVFNKPLTCQVALNYGATRNSDCRSTTSVHFYDSVSAASQCLATTVSGLTVVGGCYDLTCTAAGAVMLNAHPKSGAAAISIPCPTGTTVDLSSAAPSVYTSPTVVTCPDNAVTCADLSCAPTCNPANGQCLDGTCVCYNQWLGIDCNLHVSQVVGSFDNYSPTYPPPSTISPPPPGTTTFPPPAAGSTVDQSKQQVQLIIQTRLTMDYTALSSTTSTTVTTATLRTDFVSALAAALGVSTGDIDVTSLSGTSTTATIIAGVFPGATTVTAAYALVSPYTTNPYAQLGTAFDSKYSILGASASVTGATYVVRKKDDKVSLAVIIGVAIGGAVALSLAVSLVWWLISCCCQRSAQHHQPCDDTAEPVKGQHAVYMAQGPPQPQYAQPAYPQPGGYAQPQGQPLYANQPAHV